MLKTAIRYSLELMSAKFELLHLNGLFLFQLIVCFTGFCVAALEILAFERNKQKNDPITTFL